MQAIREILGEKTVILMAPQIIEYFKTNLDLHVKEVRTVNQDHDENLGYQYALHSDKKLRKYALDKNSYHFPASLDAGECMNLLTNHFSDVLHNSNEDFESSKEMKAFLKQLKDRFLTHQVISDSPEAAITLRFVDSLYIALILKIKDHLLQALSKSSSGNQQLLHPLLGKLNDLTQLIPELEIADLLAFKELVTRQKTSLKQEEIESDIELTLTQTLDSLDAAIHIKLNRLNPTDPTALIVDLPGLKTQILIKKSLETTQNDTYKELNTTLDITIKSALLELLLSYEKDIRSSVSDLRKTKKLALIQEMRQFCTEDGKIENLYKIMQKNEQLLTENSIGKYIYLCFCYLFGMKNNRPNYGITLFTAVDPKTSGVEISDFSTTHSQIKYE